MQYLRLIPISSAQVGTGTEKNNYYNLFEPLYLPTVWCDVTPSVLLLSTVILVLGLVRTLGPPSQERPAS